MQMYGSPYRHVLDCTIKMFHAEGIRAFYRSFTTQVLMNIPFHSTHFTVYELMQNMTNWERDYNPAAHMLSGAMAGATAAALTTPLDVCKTLLNTQEAQALQKLHKTHIHGIFNALRTVYTLRGIPGYFQGMQARVLFQMPATAISWSIYEFFKHLLAKRDSQKESVYEPAILSGDKSVAKTPLKGERGAGGWSLDDSGKTSMTSPHLPVHLLDKTFMEKGNSSSILIPK